MWNQGIPRLYLELHRACLGGVKGIEEVMGICAGICKVEGKAGEQRGRGLVPQRAEMALENKQAWDQREGGRMDGDLFAQPLEFRLEASSSKR